MDKGLTVPKWVLINWPKIPQRPQKLSAQSVCPSPKVCMVLGVYSFGMHARYKFLSAHCAGLVLWVQKSAKLKLMQGLRILKTKGAINNQLKA